MRSASPYLVCALGDLGPELTLAPERHRAARLGDDLGTPLGSLVGERTERARPEELRDALVLDTTHAKDGVVDLLGAAKAQARTASIASATNAASSMSAKKIVRAGDLLVSRLRPYLRQIAFVHPDATTALGGRPLVCSPEFFVLTSAAPPRDVAFLVPFLLGEAAQAVLHAGQEGGHHPRVPRDTLFGLRVPPAVVAGGAAESRAVRASLAAVYAALAAWSRLLAPTAPAPLDRKRKTARSPD